MSSYIKATDKQPRYKIINHHRYKFLRNYQLYKDAFAEAARWIREPGISAKVVEDKKRGVWTVWVAEKRNWRK